jgi:hypothetical protein
MVDGLGNEVLGKYGFRSNVLQQLLQSKSFALQFVEDKHDVEVRALRGQSWCAGVLR